MFPIFVIAGLTTGVYFGIKLKIKRIKRRLQEVT